MINFGSSLNLSIGRPKCSSGEQGGSHRLQRGLRLPFVSNALLNFHTYLKLQVRDRLCGVGPAIQQ